MVTMGAIAGDPVALESFRAVGAWLGHGMAALAAILDPRVFIIGGGVSEAGELLVGPHLFRHDAHPDADVLVAWNAGAGGEIRPGAY